MVHQRVHLAAWKLGHKKSGDACQHRRLGQHTISKGGLMMGLSQLAMKCQKCKYVDKCDHKRMEACAYIDDYTLIARESAASVVSAAAPVLRETVEINMDGINTLVYKDKIEQIIRNSIIPNFLCEY